MLEDRLVKLSLADHWPVEAANESHQVQEPSRPEAEVNADPESQKQKATLKEKFCWVVRDKEKFASLIRDLSELVRELNLIVLQLKIAQWQLASSKLLMQDVRHVERISRLQLLLDGAKDHHLKLLLEGAQDHGGPTSISLKDFLQAQIDQRCQQRILNSLWYRMLEHRRNSVSEAHFGTFHWALSPPTDDVEWDDLAQWLRSGSGIYWVHGKPGSGKTTLMKYLYDNAVTRSLLSEWAKDETPLMPHFFFEYGDSHPSEWRIHPSRTTRTDQILALAQD